MCESACHERRALRLYGGDEWRLQGTCCCWVSSRPSSVRQLVQPRFTHFNYSRLIGTAPLRLVSAIVACSYC